MKKILEKLSVKDRQTIERVLKSIKTDRYGRKDIIELLQWRIYGMADILLAEGKINEDDYIVLSDASKWEAA